MDNINLSIHPASALDVPPASVRDRPTDRMVSIDRAYRELIMDDIEYDILTQRYGTERMDEVVELMLEAVLSKREYIRIVGDEYPRGIVKTGY